MADPEEALHEYGVTLLPLDQLKPCDALVAAVAHQEYRTLSIDKLCGLMKETPLIMDVKGVYDRASMENANIRLWRL
jgi:UDP-N-acetyl-D-galactosamine dehydrogenase